MKKLAAVCLLLASLHARADMTITELVDAGGQSQNMTIKIKGDKMRTDIAAQMSTITDTNTGDVITIMHPQKSYLKISASKTKELITKMQAMQGQTAATATEKPKIVATGKKEKVNDYNTEIYTAESPTMKFTYWVAKDFPNAAAVQEQMKKMQDGMQSKIGTAGNSVPDISILPGLPLKTEIVTGGQTITTTLISVKQSPVDDADLQIPADYKEMQMPSFNGGGAGGGATAPSP